MSDNIKMHDTENKNDWINWIEEAVNKNQLKYYEYKEFNNFSRNWYWKFRKSLSCKLEKFRKTFSFFSLDNITVKEIVCEVIYCAINLFLF
jgi:hypothetical protein